MSEKEGQGAQVTFNLTPDGVEVLAMLSAKFEMPAEQAVLIALQEGVNTMLSRPREWYSDNQCDPHERTEALEQ